MRTWLVFVLILFCCRGCRTSCPSIEPCIERRFAQVVQVAAFERPVHSETIPPVIPDQPNLADLWSLAIDANPSLRDAAAELEAARGRLLQSGLYLNPDVTYTQSGLGDSRNSAGTLNLVLRQEIITSGKRQLDINAAARGTEVVYLALANRKFDVLGRIRRAFFDYVALAHVLDVNDEVVASLTLDTETTRKLVEEVESRPPADLVRMQALLEESKAVLVLSEATFAASWKQLAAEIGTPELRQPIQRPTFFEELPDLEESLVSGRVLAANTELKQLSKQIEQARAQLARAEAGAVPNERNRFGVLYNLDHQTCCEGPGKALTFAHRNYLCTVNCALVLSCCFFGSAVSSVRLLVSGSISQFGLIARSFAASHEEINAR